MRLIGPARVQYPVLGGMAAVGAGQLTQTLCLPLWMDGVGQSLSLGVKTASLKTHLETLIAQPGVTILSSSRPSVRV